MYLIMYSVVSICLCIITLVYLQKDGPDVVSHRTVRSLASEGTWKWGIIRGRFARKATA